MTTVSTKFRRVLAPALTLGCVLFCSAARADVSETLVAAPGTNLSDISVGETIVFDTIMSSTDAGEHLTALPDPHIFWSSFDMELESGVIAPTWSDDLTTNPIVAIWTFLAVAPSTQEVFNGWSDCNTAVSSSGCAVTNLGFSRPADSNHITFEIHAPESNAMAPLLLGITLLISMGTMRRKFGRSGGQ